MISAAEEGRPSFKIAVRVEYARVNLLNLKKMNGLGCVTGRGLELALLKSESTTLLKLSVEQAKVYELSRHPSPINDCLHYIDSHPCELASLDEGSGLRVTYFASSRAATFFDSVLQLAGEGLAVRFKQQPCLRLLDYLLGQLLPGLLTPFSLLDHLR